jgi:Holliday junction resolvase
MWASQKGSRFELELIRLLEEQGFLCTRAAGSGHSGKTLDIFAFSKRNSYWKGVTFAFECKAREKGFVIDDEQMELLNEFMETGAITRLAWKRGYKDIRIFRPEQIKKNGKHGYLGLNDWNEGIPFAQYLESVMMLTRMDPKQSTLAGSVGP